MGDPGPQERTQRGCEGLDSQATETAPGSGIKDATSITGWRRQPTAGQLPAQPVATHGLGVPQASSARSTPARPRSPLLRPAQRHPRTHGPGVRPGGTPEIPRSRMSKLRPAKPSQPGRRGPNHSALLQTVPSPLPQAGSSLTEGPCQPGASPQAPSAPVRCWALGTRNSPCPPPSRMPRVPIPHQHAAHGQLQLLTPTGQGGKRVSWPRSSQGMGGAPREAWVGGGR